MLKLKFRKLHTTIIDSVDPVSIIDFLFQEDVISHDDVSALQCMKSKYGPKQQCRDLINKLHASGNPQSFVQLYVAIKGKPYLQWLIERIDDLSVTDQLQQLYISEPTGELLLNVPGTSKMGNMLHVYTIIQSSSFSFPTFHPLSIIPLFYRSFTSSANLLLSPLTYLNSAAAIKRSAVRSLSGVLAEPNSKHT